MYGFGPRYGGYEGLGDGLGEIEAFPDFRSYGAYPGDFSGFSEDVPSNGQAGQVTVVVPPPTFTKQLWSFLKSPLGWAFVAGAVYIANKQGYLEGAKEKAKDLLGNLGDEEEVQEQG